MRTRLLTHALALTMALTTATAVGAPRPPSAVAEGGPSVTDPAIPSVPVTAPSMGPREADQATTNALSGDQPSAAGPPDGVGTFAKTPFSASASWSVAEQTGDFSWSYPLRMPQVPGGLVPAFNLSYRSSAVDGLTSATNNQASWVGDGWNLSAGFIERSYGGCAEDTEGGTTPPQTGDLCWRTDNATGTLGALVKGADGWRLKDDDGSRVERMTGAANGDDDGEHWKVTKTDGTQYFYGSSQAAGSTWTVPVFGDDVGEPCHGATFAASSCAQAWRWNLDRVVDPHGNVIVYSYEKETNSYGRNLEDTAVSYVRAGTLRKAEYGLRDGGTGPALAVVEFTSADRCVPGSQCAPDKKENWPDVPWAEKCDTPTCADRHAPTFWSTKRLARITTRTWSGTAHVDVDSWALDHQYPDPGDGEKAALWLKSITHTGHVGGTAALPPVTFEGKKMPNRVESVDGVGPLNRYRVTGIVSESGGIVDISYAAPDCVAGVSMPVSPESNALRCFPVTWSKKDFAQRTDHFHKYVVDTIRVSDRLAVNADQLTRYEYLDGAAWHFSQSEFTKPDKKTWDEFRGYGRVRVHRGDPDDTSPVTMIEHRFFRGMHGDKLPSGARNTSVTDSRGVARVDHDWLNGFAFERKTHLGQSETVVDTAIHTPGWRGPTAVRGEFEAYMVHTAATDVHTAVPSGWRITRVEHTHDEWGQTTMVNDLGDLAIAADDRCTRTSYARNTTRRMSLVHRSETVAVSCSQTPVFPDHAISDRRVAYDDGGFGAAPTVGNVTRIETLRERPASGPVYETTSTTEYDVHGRPIAVTDALDVTTTIAFTPATGGPVTQVKTTNPIGTTTVTMEKARGLTTKIRDPNGNTTEARYDPLGRTVSIWLPNRPSAGYGPSTKYAYAVHNDKPSSITTSSINTDGTYLVSTAIYDGLHRERQTQVPTDGGRLMTDTVYDSQGRVVKETRPYFNAGPVDTTLWAASDVDVPSLTFTEYDGAGRQVAQIVKTGSTERWRTTTAYEGDRVHRTPPAGGTATTTIVDALGRTTELRRYAAPTPTGAFDSTVFTYAPSGGMATATDAAGNRWRWAYDVRGDIVRFEDPDKGTTTSKYGLAGRLDSTTDARGTTLAYRYDGLGRKIEVRQGDLNGPLLQRRTYDTALFGKGMPATSTRFVDGHAYTTAVDSYTPLYAPSRSSVTVPEVEGALAGTYTTDYTYTFDGRLAGETMPPVPAAGITAGEAVTYAFDALGRPITTEAGTDDIVSATTYTKYGEVSRIHLGSPGRRTWLSRYYETDTRRLNRSIVDAEVPAPMQSDVNYTYDPAGNVTSIVDQPIGQPRDLQCFRYDHLRRLTEAWTPRHDCSARPATAELSGPAPYWHSYTYDASSNRKTEVQHSAGGDLTRTYAYPEAGKPHALEAVTSVGPDGTSVDEFGHDASGNTVSRRVGSVEQTIEWDAEGRVGQVGTAGSETSFVYTADGTRLLRKAPDATTLYLGGQEIRLPEGGTTATVTRYYRHGGEVVAMRRGATLTWLASDRQDTSQIAVESSTMAVTKRRQLPFGAPRGTAVPDLAGDRAFVGGIRDASTGLIEIGARAYDAEFGRFVSVDPVMDTGDPTQWSSYAYAGNTPVTMSDPTGQVHSCPDFDCRGGKGPNPNLPGKGSGNPGPHQPTQEEEVTAAVISTIANDGKRVLKDDDSPEAYAYWEYSATKNVVNAFSMEMLLQGHPLWIVEMFRSDYCKWLVCHVDNPVAAALCNCLVEDPLNRVTLAEAVAAGLGGKLPAGRSAGARGGQTSSPRLVAGITVHREMELAGALREIRLSKHNYTIPGLKATRNEADLMGMAWVGPGYKRASDGRTLVSADGLRQYRPPSMKPNNPDEYGGPGMYANFESRYEGQVTKRWQGNGHLVIVEGP
ncbi:RHS repeat domain-containing protein [Actinokineospora fastidiosa]|uniref:Type IV secretion protein Rhs n=1 Tax=Actinokineospora fastidiosa TaxID=1816 RepID=A0A918LJS8_9PSEU|nr:RHS repeat-associated core domain-containing protein [Actinokineospora fastidiosa]GGS58083.1 type IV secretion protein Rhs [Actinokineospora fastidiosa]